MYMGTQHLLASLSESKDEKGHRLKDTEGETEL